MMNFKLSINLHYINKSIGVKIFSYVFILIKCLQGCSKFFYGILIKAERLKTNKVEDIDNISNQILALAGNNGLLNRQFAN
jgi:hypothetical protein